MASSAHIGLASGRTARVPGSVRRNAAFTLIELLIVLMLIALVSTLVVPAVATVVRRGGLDATGQRLAELSRFAAMSAVTRHSMVVLNLDSTRGKCWVSQANAPLPWQRKEGEDAPKTQILETLTLPKGTEVSLTKAMPAAQGESGGQQWDTVTFRPNGLTEDATIELSGPTGERFTVKIAGMTGEVSTGGETRHGA